MIQRIFCRSALYGVSGAMAVVARDQRLLFRMVSVLLGLLLLAAAVLKTHQLATEPVRGTGWLESRWFVTAVVECELLLSFWLFSGLFPRAGWWISLATFAGFAVVAVAKGVSDEASCGCFGRLPTSPWLALSIDVSGVLALCACRVSPMRSGRTPPVADLVRPRVKSHDTTTAAEFRWVHAWFLGVWLTTAMVVIFFAVRRVESEKLGAIGRRIGDLIVVEPERMIRQPFELGAHIDIGDRLAHGRWLVVLYRPGCPECESLLAEWSEMVPGVIEAGIAFVSVSPALRGLPPTLADVACGELRKDERWFVTTPLIVAVADNRVLDAGVGLGLEQVAGLFCDREIVGL